MAGTGKTASWLRVIFIGLCTLSTVTSEAKKVLVVISPYCHSHQMAMERQATEVAERGHDVTFLVVYADAKRLQPTNLKSTVITYGMQGFNNTSPDTDLRIPAGTRIRAMLAALNPVMDSSCRGLLDNAEVLKKLKDWGPDLILGEMMYPCTAIIASKLNVSWVNYWGIAPLEPFFTTLWPASNRRLFVSNPISYYPQFELQTTTQLLSLWQRIQNLYMFWSAALDDYLIHYRDLMALYKEYNFDAAAVEEQRRMVLTMVPLDWAAEWIRPVPPNFKMVGPILARPGKPLPQDLRAYMEASGEQGVLLVSLGTIAELDLQQIAALADALASLSCKVLWRLTPKEVKDAAASPLVRFGNNTKVVTWLPQNDVLAHPRTRAFLSHVGINSMYEAIYHAKPIVAMPFFGDQLGNAYRVVAKGVGEQVSPSQAKTPAFREALLRVLTDPKYIIAARALAVKIKARKQSPVQEAADWVEHVLETGGDPYLTTPEAEMSMVARHSLDVYALAVACIGLALYIILKLLSAVSSRLLHLMMNQKIKAL